MGLKWLKIAFHLEPSFSLVLMWMQHTRQIINRKVNKSPSQMQLISQFCVFFLSSMNLLENSSTKKKKKKFAGEEQKSVIKFYQSTNRCMGLLLAFSSYSLSLSLSLSLTTHSVIANYQMTVSQFSATFSTGWLEEVLTCAWNPSELHGQKPISNLMSVTPSKPVGSHRRETHCVSPNSQSLFSDSTNLSHETHRQFQSPKPIALAVKLLSANLDASDAQLR